MYVLKDVLIVGRNRSIVTNTAQLRAAAQALLHKEELKSLVLRHSLRTRCGSGWRFEGRAASR